jgi:hypothetical protein
MGAAEPRGDGVSDSCHLIVLRIDDPYEAERLIRDAAAFPGEPILTPGLENEVHFSICRDASTRPACPICEHYLDEHAEVGDERSDLVPCTCCEHGR